MTSSSSTRPECCCNAATFSKSIRGRESARPRSLRAHAAIASAGLDKPVPCEPNSLRSLVEAKRREPSGFASLHGLHCSVHARSCFGTGAQWLRSKLAAALPFLMTCLVAIVGVSPLFASDESAVPANTPENELKHGPPQVLAEHLMRSREIETLLRTVVLKQDGSFGPDAIASLQQLFEYPADIFETELETWSSASIRGRAIEILRTSSPAAQRQWNLQTQALAELQLRKAVRTGSRHTIWQVARRFPQTETGIRAAILAMTMDLLSGRRFEVRQRLSELERQSDGTTLASIFQRRSESLRKTLNAMDPDPSGATGSQLSVANDLDGTSLSPPWPKATWKWSESVWKYPGVPQPIAGNALESLIPDSETSLKDFPNWQPVFWGDCIVHRSPFRIVAIDKQTGEEQWTITTNTFTPDAPAAKPSDGEPDELNVGFGRFGNEPAFQAGLSSYGLLSCDDEYLYFVDHFDFFRRTQEDVRGRNRRVPRNRMGVLQPLLSEGSSFSNGVSLIAVHRGTVGELPKIAWIAGEQSGIAYDVTKSPVAQEIDRPAEAISEEQPDASQQNSDEVDSTFRPVPVLKGHRFLGPPIGQGQQLFVLSIQKDVLWLNSLERQTGRVEWQQPLSFADDLMIRYRENADPTQVSSVCLLSNNVVVCSLSFGVLVGVRPTDGQLLWASAVREEPKPLMNRGFGLGIGPPDDMEDGLIDSPAVIIPFASDGVVVCSNSESANLFGINVANGEILWKTSRRAFGPGDIGGSPDYYIAGISGSHVIVIGERHCRSLDLRTGVQNWAIPMQPTLGRAECRDNKCLIPLANGRVAAIDLTTGREIRFRPNFLPENSVPQFGAIASDADVVCTSTPVSLAVYPRADSFFKNDGTNKSASPGESDDVLKRAQAYLIHGDDEKAIELLKSSSAVASNSANGGGSEFLRKYLGELILQDWGSKLVEPQTETARTPEDVSLIESRARLLPELGLSPEQELRAAVLTILSRPNAELSADDLSELSEFKDWTNAVAITDAWKIRPDLLLDRAGKPGVITDAELEKLTIVQLKRLAATVVLFPTVLPTDQQKQQLVTKLISTGQYSAAEALLIVWSRAADNSQPRELLARLRARNVIGGFVAAEVQKQKSPDQTPPSSSAETVSKSGLNSDAGSSIVVESEVYLETPDWDLQRVERGLAVNALPDWMPLRYFLVDGRDGLPDFVTVDMSDGSLRDRVTLPFSFHRNTLAFQAINNGLSTPALLPVAGADQLAMISAAIPDKARLQWTRRLKSDTGNSTIEFGSLGASHLIWHYGDELHCSHPVTGHDLWVRKLQLSPVSRSMAGVRRIFGDEKAVIVMGADLASFERFSTRDGRLIGNGRLSISRVSESQTVGRFLLYPDHNSRLNMFDGATGEDTLAKSDPIIVGRTHADSAFHVLPEGRVLTISSTFEVILIDTNEGRIVFRTQAASLLKTKALFGFTAFERNGFLFVGLEEQRDLVLGRLETSYRVNEPRVSAGPLLCLDKSTGEIRWSMPLLSTSIPTIFGDPTDLMVMWSNPELTEEEIRTKKQQTLSLQVVNSFTGEIIAKETSISSSRPSRCSHFASKRIIELITKDTKITVRASVADEAE